jgi:starch-binding outer membrane protein, SusD/RagB family
MKKLIYIAIIAVALFFQSCGNEFLSTKNLYEKLDVDYYKTPQDINEALAAAYTCLAIDAGNNNPTLMANLMSDDCLGGGGQADDLFHDLDRCSATAEDNFLPFWRTTYSGIFRSNMIILRGPDADYGTDETAKNQALGEAYFLRAYYYLKLAQFFGTVPLITEPSPVNYPKASEDEIFGQIASDLKKAIELMASTKFTSLPVENLGHATKWSAEGMMARAFLFYTGKYNKSEITLPEGGTVTKAQVVAWVDDCVANSGHGLIPDFRNLWPYSYANVDYPYAKNNGLSWIGEDGKNIETVFAIKYSAFGNFNNNTARLSYCNQLVLYSALREQPSLIPWGNGWGAGPVNPQLWSSYDNNDLRKKGSIIDITDPEEGNVSTDYIWGGQNANGIEETGYGQKKYTPITIPNSTGAIQSMFYILYGGQNNMQLWNMQDEVVLRFADVLLMGAELGSANAQQYFDRVRTRAGLSSKSVSLASIKEERRFELAFEGIRYFDLLRWHDEEAAFAAVKNIPVKNVAVDDVYNSSYRPETNGFLAIPESQILLSEGKLVQNPGW